MEVKISFAVILISMLFLSAFFSGAETAYTSVSPIKIKTCEKKGKYWTKLVKKHYKSFGWTISTIILSNNIVNVGISSLTTYIINDLLETGILTTIFSTIIVTPIIVIFGELLPKLLARKYAIGYLKKVVYVMNFLNYLFLPLTYPLSKIAINSKVTNTEKEIQAVLSVANSEGVLEPNEATLAKKALDLDSKKVKLVMTPKKLIVTLDSTSTVKKAKQLFAKSGFSRILVAEKNIYLGYLILKDIIFADDEQSIDRFIVPAVYVSQSTIISNTLEKMRIKGCHIALVTNKTNDEEVVGIITIEDIIEELVGEIYDEHDPVTKIKEIAHDKYIVNGSVKMEELEKTINFKFENSKNITIKKWIQSRINCKIKKNFEYKYRKKIIFKILENKNNMEKIIQISKKKN